MAKQNSQNPIREQRETNIPSIDDLTRNAISAMKNALYETELLSKERCRQKLSNSRVAGVAKEMKELLKVMSAYCC